MPVISHLGEFRAYLPPVGCLLGIDHGSKSLGIAVSDHERRIASPALTVTTKKFRARAERILTICDNRAAVGIVLGLPLNMDGTQGPQCQSVRAFAYNLGKLAELPITFCDESLSSFEAEDQLGQLGVKRRRQSESVHRVAASIMLQRALDGMRANEVPP